MPDIAALIQSGTANAWFLLPAAVVLGALHALEPGHAKSMMTAFIVAIHGTATQAVLLALSATFGHTMVVWVLAILAWQLQDTGVLVKAEPWLLLIGGLLIVILALRILTRLEPLGGLRHGHVHHYTPHDDQDTSIRMRAFTITRIIMATVTITTRATSIRTTWTRTLTLPRTPPS